MRLFKKEPNFKFMNKRYYAFLLSGLIIAAGVFTLVSRGFNLGIDFTGGTMIEVTFKEDTNINDLRSTLSQIGLGNATIIRVGNEGNKFFIKTIKAPEKSAIEEGADIEDYVSEIIKRNLQTDDEKAALAANKLDLNTASTDSIREFLLSKGIAEDLALDAAGRIVSLRSNTDGLIFTDYDAINAIGLKTRVANALTENTFLGGFSFLSNEMVGAQVGHDLRRKATLAAIWAMIGMLIYIAFRFRFIFGIAAVITLFHDVLISLSFILFFQIELSLQVIAALMTIIGYSLNDTIVIFDRVRDNIKVMRRDHAEIILDRSINQTLSRTIVTSGTTLTTVLALYFLGGEVIHSFAFTMILGIIIGTYSSIFQSCAWLKIWERFFLKRKKA